MEKVHEHNHDEADHSDNPEPDLENHLPDDSYPMQDSDIEDLNMLLQQKSGQIGNNLAEQQVNNNNKAKAK